MEGGQFNSVIVSSCIILEDETLAEQVEVEEIKNEVSLMHMFLFQS